MATQMPSARTAPAPRRHARKPAGRGVRGPVAARRAPGAPARVRWDRVGRVGLLVVLAVVVGLYVQQALSYLSTRALAQQQLSNVRRLERENAILARQQQALNDPGTIVRDARALGMVRPGERAYTITGLSSR